MYLAVLPCHRCLIKNSHRAEGVTLLHSGKCDLRVEESRLTAITAHELTRPFYSSQLPKEHARKFQSQSEAVLLGIIFQIKHVILYIPNLTILPKQNDFVPLKTFQEKLYKTQKFVN